jgi:3D (Asp-Asp-Asp) domain-containing protein
VSRGTRTSGPALAAVLVAVAIAGVLRATVPASSEAASGAVAPGSFAPWSVAPATKYRLRVDAVAYHLPGRTALGVPVRVGVVAVDPALIPLGTRLQIPGYGPGLAADVGVAIRGRIIDLWMPSTAKARQWGRRTVTITVYR